MNPVYFRTSAIIHIKNLFLSFVIIFLSSFLYSSVAYSQTTNDWFTNLPRKTIPIKTWPEGKKVAVCFILHVEEWGLGQGPVFRPDNVTRHPDFLNDSFREYSIDRGLLRVAGIFREEHLPLSLSLNALFPVRHPTVWKQLYSLVPNSPIIAHGINNTTDLLPLTQGLDAQKAYIRHTLDMIQQSTGVRPLGWSSPSVYNNADTLTATAAEGLVYSLDNMDSDQLSQLSTSSGSLILIPYPTVTVDMGQFLQRSKQPSDLERLWIDYVTELVREAETSPENEATIVAIGVHSFVVGTPDGAAALRRVLENFKNQKSVWITDVQSVTQFVEKNK